MGQKVNPISNRLGIIRGWDSNWYGGKKYGDTILEDSRLRRYLDVRLAKCSVSRIVIERTLKLVTITVCTSRPGLIIGKGGSEVEKLKEELKKITDKDVQINIFEVKRPEMDAQIVAANIARQIEGKIAYRRAVKMAVASTMRAGAEGIKVQVSGRSMVLKWLVARCSRKAVRHCTPCVPTSTTHSWKLTPKSALSALRCGFAVVKSMANVTWLPRSHRPPRKIVRPALRQDVAEASAAVPRTPVEARQAETNTKVNNIQHKRQCYNLRKPNSAVHKKAA